MRWGIALNVRDTISKTVEKAIIADKGGIDQIWVTDFPALRYAPTIAAAIAERTSNCRVGVGLISPLLYSSSHIIQFMTTLVESHGERFDLLLGPGDRYALEKIGIVQPPKTILESMKQSLDKIKTGLTESGHNCQVLLGAQGPKMIEVSLEADGVLLNYTDLEMAKWAANQLGDEITDRFQVGLFPPAFIGPCERIRNNPAISHSAAMVAIGLGKSVADQFELSSKLKAARSHLKKSGRINSQVISALDDDVLERFAFCGTVEQLQRYVKELDTIGYTSVVFGPPIGLSRKGVENLVIAKTSS
jgi:alkanesulfonate monooxygenase SsuD/methylene tetrahydromethanopterin reductase-like flavin-dependent oxidoreductase (luciferase family)